MPHSHDFDLCQYIEKNILTPPVKNLSLRAKLFCGLMILLGALWGVPWTAASGAAANIFSPGFIHDIFRYIFAFGIVLTVGVDGAWIMLEVARYVVHRKGTPKPLPKVVWTLIILLAVFSCIAPVYAAVLYNSGTSRYLALIVLAVNLGYGLYAYYKLIHKVFYQFADRTRTQHSTDRAERKKLSAGLNVLLSHGEKHALLPREIKSGKDYIEYLFKLARQTPLQSLAPKSLILGKMFFCLLIAVCVGAVNFFLTQSFLTHALHSQNIIIKIIAPLIVAIPDGIVVYISAYYLLAKLVGVFFHKHSFDDLLTRVYPRAARLLPMASLFIALLAPSAAAYITFTTLKAHADIPMMIVWLATCSMIAARFLFANFTLNHIGREILLAVAKRQKASKHVDHIIHRHRNLQRLGEILH